MRKYRVSAYFSDAPASHAYKDIAVEASSFGTAARRALDQLLADRHIKGRRIQNVRLQIQASRGNGNSGADQS